MRCRAKIDAEERSENGFEHSTNIARNCLGGVGHLYDTKFAEKSSIHGHENDILVISESLIDLTLWFTSHIESLSSSKAGLAQLKYLERFIVPALQQYRADVETSYKERHQTRIRTNNNTLFFPDC